MRKGIWLGIRSILWAFLLPGMVAGFVPWQYFDLRHRKLNLTEPLHLFALILIAAGLLLLILCIREFAHSGLGTLAPVDPPKELVIQGLYRYVRNPMYLSVLMILIGELMLIRSLGFTLYVAVWFALVNLFVLAYEEPALHRQFGDSYARYSETIGRWIPTFRSHRSDR